MWRAGSDVYGRCTGTLWMVRTAGICLGLLVCGPAGGASGPCEGVGWQSGDKQLKAACAGDLLDSTSLIVKSTRRLLGPDTRGPEECAEVW